jgi:hypothetical protein
LAKVAVVFIILLPSEYTSFFQRPASIENEADDCIGDPSVLPGPVRFGLPREPSESAISIPAMSRTPETKPTGGFPEGLNDTEPVREVAAFTLAAGKPAGRVGEKIFAPAVYNGAEVVHDGHSAMEDLENTKRRDLR